MTAYPAGRTRRPFFFCRRAPAVAVLLTLALPAQGHAAYEEKPVSGVVRGSLPDAMPAPGRAGFPFSGAAFADPVGSRGADVPFRFAVRLIVPEKWKLTLTGRFRNARRVSWKADESWGSVLDRACRIAGAAARADPVTKNVAVTGLSGSCLPPDPALKPLRPGLAAVTRPLTVTACAALLGMDPAAFLKLNGLSEDTVLRPGWAVRTGGAGPSLTPPAHGAVMPEAEPVSRAAEETGLPADSPGAGEASPAADAAGNGDPSPEEEAPEFRVVPGALAPQLADWCQDAGWQMVWRAGRDVAIVSSVSYKGPFASALEAVFRDLRAVGQPFRVTVFEGNRVVDVAEE